MRTSGTDIYIAKGDTGYLRIDFEEEISEFEFFIKTSRGETIEEDSRENGSDPYVIFKISPEITDISGVFAYDLIAEKTSDREEITTLILGSKFYVEPTARSSYPKPIKSMSGSNPEGDN